MHALFIFAAFQMPFQTLFHCYKISPYCVVLTNYAKIVNILIIWVFFQMIHIHYRMLPNTIHCSKCDGNEFMFVWSKVYI